MSDILQINWRYDKTDYAKSSETDRKTSYINSRRSSEDKYRLRACSVRKQRQEFAEKCAPRKRGPKPKTHSAKMSKYRRKNANARERMRMGEINTAFDKLKDKIPLPNIALGKIKCEKLTKINILHIAINYIRALEDILDTGELDAKIYPEKLILNPFQTPTTVAVTEPEEISAGGKKSTEMDARNSSPDSGIQDDAEEQRLQDDSDLECPDWTELKSTLDLRTAQPPTASAGLLRPNDSLEDLSGYVPPPTFSSVQVSTNLPQQEQKISQASFLLSLKSADLLSDQTKMREATTFERKRKPVTLTSRVQADNTDQQQQQQQQRRSSDFLVRNCSYSTSLTCSILPIEDTFTELLSDLETFEQIPDLEFSYEDPFTII